MARLAGLLEQKPASFPPAAVHALSEVLQAAWLRNTAQLERTLHGPGGDELRRDPRVHWPAVWAVYGWLGVGAAVNELGRENRGTRAPLPAWWTADRDYLLAHAVGLGGAVELRARPPHGTLELDLHLGLPTTLVHVAGRETRWVIDTGSSSSVLGRELAERLGFIQGPVGHEVSDSAGNQVSVVPATVRGAVAGDLELPDIPCAALDLPPEAEIDGVLAVADLCTRAVVDLDLGAGRLRVLPANPATELQGSIALPVRWVDDAPTIDCELASHGTSLMIDTGAVVDLVDPSLVAQANLPHTPIERPGLLAGAGGNSRPDEQVTAVLSIGAANLPTSFVVRACRPSPRRFGPGSWQGLLGMPSLGRDRLVFAAGGSELRWTHLSVQR